MQKKCFRILVAALLISALLVVPAFAEGAVVTGSGVNLRSGPGLNYQVVDCLPKGASVTVTDRSNGEWYAVSYNGTSGFMSSHYLSISEGTASGGESAGEGTSGCINAMYVRFRSGPSSSSAILGEYNTGKELTITGSSGDWTACIINGQAGYVFSQYVTAYDSSYEDEGIVIVPSEEPDASPSPDESDTPDSGSGEIVVVVPTAAPSPKPSATPAPAPTPDSDIIVVMPSATPSPVPTPGGDIIVVEPSPVPTPTPTPTPSPAPSVTPVEEKAGYIDGDYVRFRSGPSTGHSILGTYNRGKELTITGVSGDWTACTIDGTAGYVYAQYVRESSAAPEVPDNGGSGSGSEAGYITGNNVRFRSGPSMSSGILGELFYGNSVTITGTSGDWTAVTYNGQAGYVYSQYVAKGEYSHSSSGGTELGRQIADYALQFVGYNYTWGGMSPSTGFDCSGLTSYVYKQFGYTLNRVACDQAKNGVHVDPSDLQPGDLLCFYSGGDYIGHVGIYIGSNMFVHAANSTSGVITSELSGYYATRGYEARRII